ncbi:MAG TPA: D-tyrosyl-tRNA(Tyr) deacylase [Bacteroidales bacterium]|nr:D-tyrosyl-tRNA(Tyr) deacylase [Bacteroidales bacterium]
MRALIQRVSEASVKIEENIVGKIEQGLLVLVGFEASDALEDLDWTINKIVNLRIFSDDAGVMNKSVIEINADLLLVSQFTLHALTKKGNRPSYIKAATPEIAIPLYNKSVQLFEEKLGKSIATGIFGADMKVALINDGPVTIWIDSKNRE